MWKCSAITFATLVFLANVLSPSPASSAANKDATFVWPKESRFDCLGSLVREDGILQLAPEKGMLTWCDADISSSEEKRVLSECQLGQACRITGTIRGHGTFGWVKIISIQMRSAGAASQGLTETEARAKAAEILKGDPYGQTAAIAAGRIEKAQLLTGGSTDCAYTRVTKPVWQFRVHVPRNSTSPGTGKIL